MKTLIIFLMLSMAANLVMADDVVKNEVSLNCLGIYAPKECSKPKDKEEKKIEVVEKKKTFTSDLMYSLQANYDTTGPSVQFTVTKPIYGPVAAGAYIYNNGTVGATVQVNW